MSWDDIDAKIRRARDHLNAFKTEIDDFLNSDMNGVINDFDSDPRYLIVKAFSKSTPPKGLSILMGEILYHLRSSLDYLACQLTEDSGGVVNDVVAFPIYVGHGGAASFGILGDPKAWNFTRIGQMEMRYQQIIEDEQPFQGKHGAVDDDPLTWLYQLSNLDRHQFLHVVTAASRTGFIRVQPTEAEPRFLEVGTNFGPVEGETEVARYRITDGPSLEVEVDSNVQLDVAFADGGPLVGRFATSSLAEIGVRVAGIIQRFV